MKTLITILWLFVLNPIDYVKEHIKSVEQLRLKPYHLGGQRLIGYGHALKKKEKYRYISKQKANDLLDKDYSKLQKETDKLYPHLSEVRKQVIVALLYNMGYIPKTLHYRIKSNPDRLSLVKYSKSRGKRIKSLVQRRKFEENLWKLG